MDKSEKWALAGIVAMVLVVVVAFIAVPMWQGHQRQERVEEVGRDMGENLARDMLDPEPSQALDDEPDPAPTLSERQRRRHENAVYRRALREWPGLSHAEKARACRLAMGETADLSPMVGAENAYPYTMAWIPRCVAERLG